MSITSRDDLVAAYAGGLTYQVSWTNPSGTLLVNQQLASGFWHGRTTTAAPPATPVQCTSATSGCLAPFPAPNPGKSWYIGAVNLVDDQANGGQLYLFDRLAHMWINMSGSSYSQSFSMTRPARSTSAVGVHAFLEISAGPGSNIFTGNTFTITYTNSAGVSGRTSDLYLSSVFTGNSGSLMRFVLSGGDRGVASIERLSISGSAWSPTQMNLVLAKPLHTMPLSYPNCGAGVSHGFMDINQQINGDACLMLAASPTYARAVRGTIRLIQG